MQGIAGRARVRIQSAIPDRLIEVHSDIVGGAYTRVTPYRAGDVVAVQQFPDVHVPVANVIR